MNGRTNSNGTTTDTIQIPLDPVTNLDAVAGNAQVTLTWTDPLNKYATPEGEQAGDPDQLVSVWSYTAIVRKEGSAPTGIHDGILVAESQVHNQYQTNGYVDSGLTNDTLYYYGLFAVNEDSIESEVTASEGVTPTAGVEASTLPLGTLIKFQENGVVAEYMIIHQGNPDTSEYDESCNGTWCLRYKIPTEKTEWNGYQNVYKNSIVDTYLNNDFLNKFNDNIRNIIKSIKLPYYDGSGNYGSGGEYRNLADGMDCKIFLLSVDEIGAYDRGVNLPSENLYDYSDEGSKLDYFIQDTSPNSNPQAEALRKTTVDTGSNSGAYALRSIVFGFAIEAVGISLSSGTADTIKIKERQYIRPAFIIPSDTIIDHDMNVIA